MIKREEPKMTIPQYLEAILTELKKMNKEKNPKDPKKKIETREKKSILDIF